MFFTVRHLFFLLFFLIGQSQLGFGQSQEEDEFLQYEPTFTAVSSLFFRPGTDYKVFFTVNPHPNNAPLQFKGVLMANSSESTTIESESISLRPGESGQISIPLPRKMPRNETVWRLFAWRFWPESEPDEYKIIAPYTIIFSSELPNEDNQSLQNPDIYDHDLASVFIQTDKPAYKPNDLVRIRVITMGSNDLPHLTAGVNMIITDSQGNIMKRWQQPLQLPESATVQSNVSSNGNPNVALFGEYQKKKNGLSSYEYQLSSEPILGNWTIQVEAGNIKEKMYFEVQKYILPKFQVKIETPSVLYGTGNISTATTIKVSYTYGKGLQGTGTVTVTSNNTGRTTLQQIVVKDGEVTVPVTLSGSNIYSTVHTITANVTEKNTGRWQIGTKTVRIFPREIYFVQWINKPAKYKAGLPITVQLKITGQDGLPVKDVRHNSLRITFSASLNVKEKQTSIPLSGIATFTFPTPSQPIPANSTFQVLYKHATYYFTMPTAERATSSGILIELISPPDTSNFIPGNSYNFTIRSNKRIKPKVFHCLLWDDAAMEVHGAQTIVNNSPRENKTEFPFSLRIPKGPYEELKIFVYFETADDRENSQLISTSKSIRIINNYLKIRVSRPIPTTTSVPFTATAEEAFFYVDYPNDDSGVGEAKEQQSEISSKLEVEPGDAVEIHFETYPGSTIAIRGIDQSLLLLTEQDNDLNQEKVERKRASSQSRPFNLDNIPKDTHVGCFRDNPSFLKTFHRLGIVVLLSNRDESFSGLCATSSGSSLQEAEMAPSPNAVPDAPTTPPQVDSRLRTKFPETWLWEEFESSNDSSTTILSKTLPDTLTSWIISGFSLNPKTGLGVANPATITGFMPFFVTLNLPYSVVKYESFDLQVIVHNYLDRDVNVFVTLFNRHNDFGFDVDDRQNNQTGNKTRSIKVQKNHAALAHFIITPLVIGDIPIEVKAVAEDGTAGDSMLRHLKVKPDGVRETRSQTVTFDPIPGAKNVSREASFDVECPENVVKGASSLQLTVVGDPMATIMSQLATPRRSRSSSSSSSSNSRSNLGHLLRIPSGCGEQNMIGLVPNILVLHYLTATNSDEKDVMQTAKRNLETGYGNQLQYQKGDGSFAVWAFSEGTTWLTSYVLRWFVEAQKYITIDNNVIRRATEFLLSRQRPDGSFLSLVAGPKYHPELCLYGCNGVALTAYITLALIKVNESSNNKLNLQAAIENGMNFISTPSVYQLDDNYITNLVAATLMAGNHPEKTRFFEKMEKTAKTATNAQGVNVKYWDMKYERERASSPLAIEMTSYALLAHLWEKGEIDSSAPDVHRWLLSQRNPNGGFLSTQDTAMGLTALTEFALSELAIKTKIVDNSTSKIVDEDKIELSIRASGSSCSNSSRINANSDFNFSDNSNDTEIQVSVLRWNRMVLQEFELPVSAKKISLHVRGSGRAVVQMTQTWYVPTQNKLTTNSSDHFNITAKMRIPDPEEPSETELKLCVNSNHANGSGDSIASVQLPSGYIFSPEDYGDNSEFMMKRPENVQRFELTEGNGKMDVYFSEILGQPPTCFSLAATQQLEVANAKNPVIEVYEYLDPARKGRIVYEPAHNITRCQLAQQTGACDDEECD